MPATKDEIALTFMGLAFRYGFRRTAVEDVANALRISKKTIYEEFSSKEAMLEYALELAAIEQRKRVESLLTETTALGRALQVTRIALADARAGFEQNPGVELVDPGLQSQVNDRVYGPLVRDLLEQGVAAGEFQVPDVEMTSQFIQAVGMEAVRQIHDYPASQPEEAAVEAVRRLVTGGGGSVSPVASSERTSPQPDGAAEPRKPRKKSRRK